MNLRRILVAAALCMVGAEVMAQQKDERLDSVIVSASRAGKNTPVTYENLGKDAMRRANPQASLPMALELLPSVVTYNEGGTGLGNSAMTVRGSKGSQINVTLNGITLNDAESQEVFWVNIPALTGLISSVQVQRGLGTSANGAGAFGASINMNTSFVTPEPHATMDFSGGSWDTFLSRVAVSSGLQRSGLYASAVYANGSTEGYIQDARVKSQSAFVTLGWMGAKNSLKLTWLAGKQRSGITWDGISPEQYEADRRFNPSGEDTDNYIQHHLQLNYTRAFSHSLTHTTTLNYTRGDGYDEYHRTARKLANYGFPSLPPGTPAKSDMIYRKLMGNDYWVLNSDLRYRSASLDVTGGVCASSYTGDHWGDVLWAEQLGSGYDYSSVNWYSNVGRKYDISVFARSEYRPSESLTAYIDLHYRGVRLDMWGVDDDWLEYGASDADRLSYGRIWNFFNPRAGLTYASGPNRAYLSLAFGNREPGRGDIKENVKGDGSNPIVPEKMIDVELGYALHLSGLSLSANIYMMEYFDMLLETGRLSTAGYAIKENVPRAWRRGVELSAAWTPSRFLRADANATVSVNIIKDYTSYVPYDDYSGVYPVSYGCTTMLLSPSVTGMGRIVASPWDGWDVEASVKYVGKQYIDNSERDLLSIPAYWTANLCVSKQWGPFSAALYVNNIFNREYYASGYRWETCNASGSVKTINTNVRIYPQATRNFMIKTSLSF